MMAVLHTVNKSPFDRDTLSSCLRLARAGSTILLIEDGVYAALRGTAVEETLRGALDAHGIHVLEPDLLARGLDPGQLIEGIERVDYGGFVDLAAAHDSVQAWL